MLFCMVLLPDEALTLAKDLDRTTQEDGLGRADYQVLCSGFSFFVKHANQHIKFKFTGTLGICRGFMDFFHSYNDVSKDTNDQAYQLSQCTICVYSISGYFNACSTLKFSLLASITLQWCQWLNAYRVRMPSHRLLYPDICMQQQTLSTVALALFYRYMQLASYVCTMMYHITSTCSYSQLYARPYNRPFIAILC